MVIMVRCIYIKEPELSFRLLKLHFTDTVYQQFLLF